MPTEGNTSGAETTSPDERVHNAWLAELLMRERDLVAEYWFQEIRSADIPRYRTVPDEVLRQELPPTVDSMIHAFRTGETEGPRQHSFDIFRQRLTQGFVLPELQAALHALATAAIRVVMGANVGVRHELDALQSISDMYFQVAEIGAIVYEQLRVEQQNRFATAYEFGVTLSGILDLDTLLDTAVRRLAEYMHVKSAAILLADGKGGQGEVRAQHDLHGSLLEALPAACTALGCSMEGADVVDMREAACVVPDVRADRRLDTWSELLASHGYVSLVCAPLQAKRRALGVLVMLWAEAHADAGPEMDLLFAMAGHIASSLQNAILYGEARGKRELGVLLQASRLFAASTDTEDLLRKVARMAAKAVNADISIVFTPDGVVGGLQRIGLYARSGDSRRAVQRIMRAVAAEGRDGRYGSLVHGLENRKPFLIADYAEFTGRLPSLVGAIGSVLVVPLECKGSLIGGLILISLTRDSFTNYDLSLATALGDVASVAIENVQLFEYERNIAETLQRSFLPDTLPVIEGYEIAAHYRPAMAEAEIGGDFYDVFPAGKDGIGIIIADVSGKGLNAAVQTAMGKYMVRAYSSENPLPSSVLSRFNSAFHAYAKEGMFITAFYGVLDPESNAFTYGSAGHNPPMLYSAATGRVRQFPMGGIGLGIIRNAEYTDNSVTMEPGDVLLLYTDGATDVVSDGQRLEVEGLEELFLACVDGSAEEIVRRLFDGIRAYSHGALVDDVALVALKRPASADPVATE